MNAAERLRPLARLLSPTRQLIREGTTRWRALPTRDRFAVGIAALVMALAFLWLALTRPALDTIAQWRRDLPKLQAQSAELDGILAGVPAANGRPGAAAEPLQAGLDRAGLQGFYKIHDVVADAPAATGGRLLPAKAWRIEFTGPAPAAQVFSWLLAVSARSDVEVVRADLERADGSAEAQGPVRGAVDLQSTQINKDGP
ncbi:type II secretion system protein GspM [Variovorax sp. W2I14]|uniref:type II secretion system protein GspM n=1 Tax=Variovorax sp. W2I14 TaxID=3042290 RepID=UPI003D1D743B